MVFQIDREKRIVEGVDAERGIRGQGIVIVGEACVGVVVEAEAQAAHLAAAPIWQQLVRAHIKEKAFVGLGVIGDLNPQDCRIPLRAGLREMNPVVSNGKIEAEYGRRQSRIVIDPGIGIAGIRIQRIRVKKKREIPGFSRQLRQKIRRADGPLDLKGIDVRKSG